MQTQQICHKCYLYNSPISLETKDELKGLEPWSGKFILLIYMAKEKYSPLAFVDQKH